MLVVGVAETGELVEFGVGAWVPGPPVLVSPQDVRSTARSKDETMHCHNQMRFIALPPKESTERSIYRSHRFVIGSR